MIEARGKPGTFKSEEGNPQARQKGAPLHRKLVESVGKSHKSGRSADGSCRRGGNKFMERHRIRGMVTNSRSCIGIRICQLDDKCEHDSANKEGKQGTKNIVAESRGRFPRPRNDEACCDCQDNPFPHRMEEGSENGLHQDVARPRSMAYPFYKRRFHLIKFTNFHRLSSFFRYSFISFSSFFDVFLLPNSSMTSLLA